MTELEHAIDAIEHGLPAVTRNGERPVKKKEVCYETGDTQVLEPWVSLPVSDGAGRLFSSVQDLFLWDRALYTGQLLPRLEWCSSHE